MSELAFFTGRNSTVRRPRRRLRTAGDFVALPFVLIATVFVLPLMALIAIAVLLEGDGPVLFRQQRIGKGGRPFDCLKFRTMAEAAEARLAELLAADPQTQQEWLVSHKLRQDPRVTPLGRFLRRSSLDELPQLFNILRGEMALVGPRPIVAEEIPLFGKHFRHYCAVRPGITGLWQVSGRNDVSFRQRIILDVAYVRNKCLRLDICILAKTVPVVLGQRGSY